MQKRVDDQKRTVKSIQIAERIHDLIAHYAETTGGSVEGIATRAILEYFDRRKISQNKHK